MKLKPLFRKIRISLIRLFTKKTATKLSDMEDTYYLISDTPLSIFIDAVCDNKIERLNKRGKKNTNSVLLKSRDNLCYEFSDICGSGATKLYYESIKITGAIKASIRALHFCSFMLDHDMRDEAVTRLKLLGISGDNLHSRIDMKIKDKQVQLTRKEAEFKAIIASQQNQKLESEYFEKLLIRLSKYMAQMIDKNSITVLQFAYMLNDYNEYLTVKNNNNG